MHRIQTARASSSEHLNEFLSPPARAFVHTIKQTTEHTLPTNNIPISSTIRTTNETRTIEGIPKSTSSRSIPSFAETQLLSVYSPSQNPPTLSNNDKCIFVEQQDRQPTTYHVSKVSPLDTKSTQTSLPLSTHSSTLVIRGTPPTKTNYKQYVKIHSGSQQLSNDVASQPSSSNELVQESNYTYEEYVLDIDDKQIRSSQTPSSSSTSSATTVVSRNPQVDANKNSNNVTLVLKKDEKTTVDTQNVASIRHLTDSDSRHVYDQLQQFDYYPINQTKRIQNHLDKTDIQTNATSSRVNALCSVFEQQNRASSSSNVVNSTNLTSNVERNQRSSNDADEIRIHTKDATASYIHHAQPVQIVHQTTKQEDQASSRFTIERIQQITGKSLTNLNDVGHYLQDGRTWQWNEIFWLSLTNAQRDQLKLLEQQLQSSRDSTNRLSVEDTSRQSTISMEKPRFKTVINIPTTNVVQKDLLSSKVNEKAPTTVIKVVNTTSTTTDIRISSRESSPNRENISTTDNTKVAANHNLSNGQQQFRPISTPLIQRPMVNETNTDSLTYEQFIFDYLSTHARHERSKSNTLILTVDQQQIHIPDIQLPASNEKFNLSKAVCLRLIDRDLPPFETELNQLVIFIANEVVVLPVDLWAVYRQKYRNATWVRELQCVDRRIPLLLMPSIERWLADHTNVLIKQRMLNVDGVDIPMKGHSIFYELEQTNGSYWNKILNYLLRVGCASYAANKNIVRIARSELDVRRLLANSSSKIHERIVEYLRTLKTVGFRNGRLFLTDYFSLPNEYVRNFHKPGETLNTTDIANVLLQICDILEDDDGQTLILTYDNQTLTISDGEDYKYLLIQWLDQLNQAGLIELTQENDIIIRTSDKDTAKQIFIKHEHIDDYMTKNKAQQTDVINSHDIANILLIHDYIYYKSGQFVFPMQDIVLDTHQFSWLRSAIRSISSDTDNEETLVEFFDGSTKQVLHIPFAYMPPTEDDELVTSYLFENGQIEYDKNTKSYSYRYKLSNEMHLSTQQYKDQHDRLAHNIQHIHTYDSARSVDIEFTRDPNHRLTLPSGWYKQIYEHSFDRSYIIRLLLTNGGAIDGNNFIFNGQSFALVPLDAPSSDTCDPEKEKLIDYYVEFINSQGEIKYDHMKRVLILENLADGSRLCLTPQHSEFIQKNQYRREDVKYVLQRYGEIKQDEFQNWLLHYNNQCIQLPTANTNNYDGVECFDPENQEAYLKKFFEAIDFMYNHNLIKYVKQYKFFQFHFSNQILTIPLSQLHSIINNNNARTLKLLDINIFPFNSYQISQWLIKNCDEINYLHNGFLEMIFKNKCYYLPLTFKDDTNLKLLFPSTVSLRLIQKTPSTTTLDIEQPNESNNYAIDPLLLLANYIHRAASIYEDEFGRLVIKLDKHEIVIPRVESISSIEAIITSPNRTGSIIARLINRIGKVESNEMGGLIITVGKNSFELTLETIERANKLFFDNLNHFKTRQRQQANRSPVLPMLQYSKSASDLTSLNAVKYSSFIDDQQMLYTKDGRGDARYLNLTQMKKENSSHTSIGPSLHAELSVLIMTDGTEGLPPNRAIRFYIRYNTNSIFAMESHRTATTTPFDRSKQLQLVSPEQYRNAALRDAPVYVSKPGETIIYYENLAQYLAIEKLRLSSRVVRRMLKYSSRDEYFAYLNKNMSTIQAEELLKESEEPFNYKYFNNQQRSRSPGRVYNVQNGRSPQSTNGTGVHSLLVSDKNVTLPRSTASGQSNDGESESRVTVSRSASAAAKVVSSKSDTMKSNTSSSGPSSRENTTISSAAVMRTQSLISPNRTSGSKGPEDEPKKEKKSKFRTPSFLRRRKEKKEKEAAHKEKSEK